MRKHGGILRAIYFIPSAISLTVAGLLFYFIYQPQTGLLNEFLRIVGLGDLAHAWLGQESTAIWAIIVMSQWQSFGYTALLYSVAIQRIPRELYDAADLDGVGSISRIWHITTPLVREMSTLLIIVTVTGAFQVFNEVMVMTSGGPNNSSQVLGTWLYPRRFHQQRVRVRGGDRHRGVRDHDRAGRRPAVDRSAEEGRMVTRIRFAGIVLRLLVWGLLVAIALIVVVPLGWMLLSSLKVNQQFLSDPFGLPTTFNWSNYVDAWNLGVGQYMINSVIVTLVSIVATTLISAWAAFGLTKLTMPFSRTVLFLIVGGMMLAPTVALIPLLRILQGLGIYDSLLGLIILYTAFRIPFTTFLIRSYMVDLPHEVDEAALLDGASRTQQFWRLTLPMSMPIVVSAVILQCLFAWNEYLFAFIFVSSTDTMTLPVGLANLASKLSTNYPMIFAGMTLASVPMIVFFFAAQRFFVRGLAEGIGK